MMLRANQMVVATRQFSHKLRKPNTWFVQPAQNRCLIVIGKFLNCPTAKERGGEAALSPFECPALTQAWP
jgi:hypothetical protein